MFIMWHTESNIRSQTMLYSCLGVVQSVLCTALSQVHSASMRDSSPSIAISLAEAIASWTWGPSPCPTILSWTMTSVCQWVRVVRWMLRTRRAAAGRVLVCAVQRPLPASLGLQEELEPGLGAAVGDLWAVSSHPRRNVLGVHDAQRREIKAAVLSDGANDSLERRSKGLSSAHASPRLTLKSDVCSQYSRWS